MTRYRVEWFEGGQWNKYETFDSMAEAEICVIKALGGFEHTRVVVVIA